MNGDGFYDCECIPGFFGDGFDASGCSNIDECAAEINVCFNENTYCMDSIGLRLTDNKASGISNRSNDP